MPYPQWRYWAKVQKQNAEKRAITASSLTAALNSSRCTLWELSIRNEVEKLKGRVAYRATDVWKKWAARKVHQVRTRSKRRCFSSKAMQKAPPNSWEDFAKKSKVTIDWKNTYAKKMNNPWVRWAETKRISHHLRKRESLVNEQLESLDPFWNVAIRHQLKVLNAKRRAAKCQQRKTS